MDNTEPRHVDRRDQGLRRQRLVTQAAAIGAAMLSIAFGWIFAQGSSASAEEKGSTEPAAVESSEKPAGKAPEKSEKPEKSAGKAPESAGSGPGESPTGDESDDGDEEDDQDEGAAELAPPPAAPAPAPQQESDATSGGS